MTHPCNPHSSQSLDYAKRTRDHAIQTQNILPTMGQKKRLTNMGIGGSSGNMELRWNKVAS